MATAATVVCIRGPSGSGKTTLAEALTRRLAADSLRIGFVKRCHHLLDTAGKDSDRIATAGASAVLVHDAGGAALFRQDHASLTTLLGLLPPAIDLVLVETFRPERFPVVLTDGVDSVEGESVLLRVGRAPFDTRVLDGAADRILAVHRARFAAVNPAPVAHAHRCAGAVLGRRLAQCGAAQLGLAIPRADRRLHVICENDGCAADAIGAATGCRPGDRTLRFRYLGKLAATFIDAEVGRAVRVAARGDCRQIAARLYPDMDRRLAQLLTYQSLPDDQLFIVRPVEFGCIPATRRQHRLCAVCGEEVDSDATVQIDHVTYCQPCARVGITGGPYNDGGRA
jgi:formylmethanofuran dehydrogenase subunit E